MGLKKYLSASIVLFLIILTMAPCLAKENNTEIKTSGPCGKGYRYNIQGWVYIHIEGEPYERGYQYGYLATEEIVDMMERWSNWGHTQNILKRLSLDIDSPRYDDISVIWWEYCKSKAKRMFLENYPQEYIQEMKGVADGVKACGGTIHGHLVEFDDVLTLNEIVDCWFSYDNINQRFHPLGGLFNGLINLFSKEQKGMCSAFIASGDATENGEIVIAHSTHVPKLYLSERFNIILDVQPSTGNRFIMTCPPGTITSMMDYYQNEKGIVLTETTYPQGPWKSNGISIPVRSRLAIQYSDSIDDVIKYLKNGNNGLYACEWLIGDTKTGEIASIELALYNTPVKRTYDGFYWSCNYPHDPKVQSEIYGVRPGLYNIVTRIIPNIVDPRVDKFKEIEKEYYGKINLQTAKEILGIYPICRTSSDGKITDTNLMQNLGMLVYMGNPNGTTWAVSNEWESKFKGITDLPSVGWIELYPLISNPKKIIKKEKQKEPLKQSKLLWQSKSTIWEDRDISLSKELDMKTLGFNSNENTYYRFDIKKGEMLWEKEINGPITALPRIIDKVIYIGSWDGNIYALDLENGDTIWKYQTGWGIDSTSIVSKDRVFIGGLDNNFYALDKKTGELDWYFTCKSAIHSSPIAYGEYVFFGSDDGRFYALNQEDGELIWSFKPGYCLGNDANSYLTTAICSNPFIDDGAVCIEVDGTVYALDPQTNEIKAEDAVIKSSTNNNYVILLIAFLVIISIVFLVVYSNRKCK